MLVDDQEIERTALRTILAEEPNWTTTEAIDGQAALDLLCSDLRPQLCLVDLRMPNVDGLEFLRRVRRDPDLRELKIMIMSASRDRDTIVELAKLSIEGYLLKPFDPQRTLAAVRPVMAQLPDPDVVNGPVRDLLTKVALIADDDDVARQTLAAMVRSEKHWDVLEAGDGVKALELLKNGPIPDYMFVDLHMPDLDGMALLAEIRKNQKWDKLRIAVTSAERDREKVKALARMRIEAYLLKPIDAVKLRASLRAVA